MIIAPPEHPNCRSTLLPERIKKPAKAWRYWLRPWFDPSVIELRDPSQGMRKITPSEPIASDDVYPCRDSAETAGRETQARAQAVIDAGGVPMSVEYVDSLPDGEQP